MNNTQMIERIREQLSEDELLCQLAEECAELAKAALKVRRATSGVNPTPVGRDEAFKQLIEECADVLLCMDVIAYIKEHDCEMAKIMDQKLQRWVERIDHPELLPYGSTAWWVCKNGLHGWHISMVMVLNRYIGGSGDELVYLEDFPSTHTTYSVPVSHFGTLIFKDKADAERVLRTKLRPARAFKLGISKKSKER